MNPQRHDRTGLGRAMDSRGRSQDRVPGLGERLAAGLALFLALFAAGLLAGHVDPTAAQSLPLQSTGTPTTLPTVVRTSQPTDLPPPASVTPAPSPGSRSACSAAGRSAR